MESVRGTNPGHLEEGQLTVLLETLLTSRMVHARALSAFLGAYGALRDVQYVMLRGIATLCTKRREDRTTDHAAPSDDVHTNADVLSNDDVARNVYDALMCIYHAALELRQDADAAEQDELHQANGEPAAVSYKVIVVVHHTVCNAVGTCCCTQLCIHTRIIDTGITTQTWSGLHEAGLAVPAHAGQRARDRRKRRRMQADAQEQTAPTEAVAAAWANDKLFRKVYRCDNGFLRMMVGVSRGTL